MKYTDPMKAWPKFRDKVRRRMIKGAKMYENKAIYRHPDDLLNEVEEELFDVCGWALCLYARLENIREEVNDIIMKKKGEKRYDKGEKRHAS